MYNITAAKLIKKNYTIPIFFLNAINLFDGVQ